MWKLYGIQISSVHRSSFIGIELHALVYMLSLTDFTLKKANLSIWNGDDLTSLRYLGSHPLLKKLSVA